MLLAQSAYEAAPLSASYPAIVTAQLLGGMSLGVWLLGGRIQHGTVELAVSGATLLIMVLGIYLLTTSPLLTGQLDQLVRQQDAGHAAHVEARLEQELNRADRDSQRAENRLAPQGAAVPDRHLKRELDRVEAGIRRLQRLQDDIRRHREAERQRIGERADGDTNLAEQERRQREQERRIDECARQLQGTADRLLERWIPGSSPTRNG